MRVKRWARESERLAEGFGAAPAVQIDGELQDRLRALGYTE